MANLTFFGATGGQVTGSCYLLETHNHRREKAAALSLQTSFKRRGWDATIPKLGDKIAF